MIGEGGDPHVSEGGGSPCGILTDGPHGSREKRLALFLYDSPGTVEPGITVPPRCKKDLC